MRTSDFDYQLPPERIAQTPLEPRDSSRLMILDRASGTIYHKHFYDISEFLNPGDLLVRNQTRVLPARIHAQKRNTGGKVEILLLRRLEPERWEALVGGKRVCAKSELYLSDTLSATVEQTLEGSRRIIRFQGDLGSFLKTSGQMPLPPYIHERLEDPDRYQTVYARTDQCGSAAAPTAGLHFSERLMTELSEKRGVRFADVTLHVGLDTFLPVREENPMEHTIHHEWCEITPETAALILDARARGKRVIAVGTTSARTLESGAQAALEQGAGQSLIPIHGDTGIYILPGYQFRCVDALITNFHLPKSTLLMMVSAFAGRERILAAYQQAIDMQYRFFSFGDAMLIL